MHRLIIGIVIIAIFWIGYLVYTGKLTTQATDPKLNNIPTLKDVLSQTEGQLTLATSTLGLNGFTDPNPPNDPKLLQQNVITRDLISEDVVRQNYNNILKQVQISTDTGTGQGVQTKTVDYQTFLQMLGLQPSTNVNVPSGQIKLVSDPTAGLNSLALTQETINRARTDPQLASAIQNSQYRIVNKQLGIGV